MKRRYVTTTVPKWGRALLGIGEYAAYEAARRGEIPTIQIGKRKLVPVAVGEKTLGLDPGDADELLDGLDSDQAQSTDGPANSPDGAAEPLDTREKVDSQAG